MPNRKDETRAARTPIVIVFMAFLDRLISPKVVAKERATFGPSTGAITIAPMIKTTLFRNIPTEATIEEKITSTIKTQETLTVFSISE